MTYGVDVSLGEDGNDLCWFFTCACVRPHSWCPFAQPPSRVGRVISMLNSRPQGACLLGCLFFTVASWWVASEAGAGREREADFPRAEFLRRRSWNCVAVYSCSRNRCRVFPCCWGEAYKLDALVVIIQLTSSQFNSTNIY